MLVQEQRGHGPDAEPVPEADLKAGSRRGKVAKRCAMRLSRRVLAALGQGQPTVGLGRPRRALIRARARLMVVTSMRTPVNRAMVSTSNSRVQVGRRQR